MSILPVVGQSVDVLHGNGRIAGSINYAAVVLSVSPTGSRVTVAHPKYATGKAVFYRSKESSVWVESYGGVSALNDYFRCDAEPVAVVEPAVAAEPDKMANARSQAWAQYESICELVEAVRMASDDDAYADGAEALASAAGFSVGWYERGECEGHYWRKGDAFGDEGHADASDAWVACCDDNDLRPSDDDARRAIHEDALSVEVRSDWREPGGDAAASEFRVLLCTGGPAVQIRGELSEHGEPTRAWLQCQDWFTSWQDVVVDRNGAVIDGDVLLAYCSEFYFGEG
jgi:hypothetical protein